MWLKKQFTSYQKVNNEKQISFDFYSWVVTHQQLNMNYIGGNINNRGRYNAGFADAPSELISGFLMRSQDDLLHWIVESVSW